MWKKIIPLICLAGLIAWGVFHYIQDQNKQTASRLENTPLNEANSSDLKQNKGKVNNQKTSDDRTSERLEKPKVGIEKGDMAPDFTLKNLQGEEVKLSDFRGKKVVLNFWYSYCPPCKVEAPELQKFYQSHKDNDFTVLAVDLRVIEKSTSAVKKFAKDNGLGFPIVLDEKGNVSDTYMIMGFPSSYFIDKQGMIRYKVRGAMNREMMKEIMVKMK